MYTMLAQNSVMFTLYRRKMDSMETGLFLSNTSSLCSTSWFVQRPRSDQSIECCQVITSPLQIEIDCFPFLTCLDLLCATLYISLSQIHISLLTKSNNEFLVVFSQVQRYLSCKVFPDSRGEVLPPPSLHSVADIHLL